MTKLLAADCGAIPNRQSAPRNALSARTARAQFSSERELSSTARAQSLRLATRTSCIPYSQVDFISTVEWDVIADALMERAAVPSLLRYVRVLRVARVSRIVMTLTQFSTTKQSVRDGDES